LEAQDLALLEYSQQVGSPIIKVYTEVETGKKSDRPELAKALAHAKRAKATLVVAKLDRLARNVAFTAALMENGVDFVACDMPTANRLTIHILAAVAEAEAKAISDRTKAALAAYKARGGVLGCRPGNCPIPKDAGRRGAIRAGEVVAEKADAAYADLDFVLEWRQLGLTQKGIADRLNSEGHTCRRGGVWTQSLVSRLLRRLSRKNRSV
jgi:DNA invertase Pin-like site-specific DNA recombinase